MTKHVDQLLKEIWKDPFSDAPRLVLADHFEQEAELDRANLIRLQIRGEALPYWDSQSLGIELQQRAILRKRDEEWRGKLPVIEGVRWGRFTRGFVATVAFDDVETLEEHRERCLTAAPVEAIALRWPAAAKPPKLARIATLRRLTMVGSVMRPEDLKWLASCPLLSTIRELTLIDSDLQSGLPHLLKSPHLAQLEALRVPLHQLGNAGLKKLIAASLPSLAELDLSVGSDEQLGSGRRSAPASITSKGVLEFAAWSGLSKVHTLDLSASKLGSDGLLMLLASPHTKALKTLCIRAIKDSDWDMDDSMTAFKSGPAGMLDELDISDNDLDPEGALHLAESKAMRELKVLRIGNVRSNSFERLAKASWVRSLRVLACGEQALPHFLRRVPEQLHHVEITASSMPLSRVVPHLADNPPPALRSLDLTGSRVDDEGLRRLGALELPALVSVALPPTRPGFSLAAIRAFAESPLGKQLTSLDANVPEVDRLPEPRALDIGDGEYDGAHRYL